MPRGRGRRIRTPSSPASPSTSATTLNGPGIQPQLPQPQPHGSITFFNPPQTQPQAQPQGSQHPPPAHAAGGPGGATSNPINLTVSWQSQLPPYPNFNIAQHPWTVLPSSGSGSGYPTIPPPFPLPFLPSMAAPGPSYPSGSGNQPTSNGGQIPPAPVATATAPVVPPPPQMPPQTATRGRGRGRGGGGRGRPRKISVYTIGMGPGLTPSSAVAAPAPTSTQSAVPGFLGGAPQPPPAHTSTYVFPAAPLGPLPNINLQPTQTPVHMSRHRPTTVQVQYSYPGSSSARGSSAGPPLWSLLPPTMGKPPCPPNWAQSLLQARSQVTSPFLKLPVVKNSAEYTALSQLFGPMMTDANRVVNPELWRRFIRSRTDLLTSKSDDLILLASLGLSEEEVAQRAHVAFNFDKQHLNGSPYCDNVVLLFHGSRGHGSVDTILSQGLDERLGNTGGLMGRGIYFSDDPQKAMQYDTNGVLIVFAVMLGDCLAIPHGGSGAVREPEKTVTQKRNHQDLFFDSIVGRPTTVHNEYVVFNRAQCCPLYTISYNKWGQATPTVPTWNQTPSYNDHVSARHYLPTFAWGVSSSGTGQSPFYARRIFAAMAADEVGMETEDDEDDSRRGAGVGAGTKQTQIQASLKSAQELQDEESLALKLSQLTELGFWDDEKNKELLEQFQGNLEMTIDYLLEEAAGAGAANANAANNQAHASNAAVAMAVADPIPIPGTSAAAAAAMTTSNAVPQNLSTPKIFSLYDTIDLTDTDEETNSPASSKLPRLGGSTQNLAKGAAADAPSSPTDWLDSLMKDYDVSPKDMSMNEAEDDDGGGGGTGTGDGDGDKATADAEEEEEAPTPPPTEEECPICFVEYSLGADGAADWQTLPCSHKICTACHGQMKSSGTTMSGQSHTYIKCPFCQACAGIQIGTCPDGSMTVLKLASPASGYPACGSLSIRYYVHSGRYTLDRTAYLPDNAEGQHILTLLRTAWDRRLCFTIGTSMTTGAKDVLVWNIHHKTALHGGTHGYPDPTYLQRVAQELAQYGIQ